jgi:hypothetical protein
MPPKVPRGPVPGRPGTSASPEVRRRLNRLSYFALALVLLTLILTFLPIDSEPWVWVKLAILTVPTIVFLVGVVRFSLWQRDEYWRERGRDPKHPDRLPDHPAD